MMDKAFPHPSSHKQVSPSRIPQPGVYKTGFSNHAAPIRLPQSKLPQKRFPKKSCDTHCYTARLGVHKNRLPQTDFDNQASFTQAFLNQTRGFLLPGRRSESTGNGKSFKASWATGSAVSTLIDEVGHANIAR